MKKPKITGLFQHGTPIVRAHVWTDKGYSTKTFANSAEAQSWINQRTVK